MSIVACHSIRTHPFPTIFSFFNSIKEEFAYNFRRLCWFVFFFVLVGNFIKFFHGPVFYCFFIFRIWIFKLFSLVNVKIEIFAFKCQIMWILAFFAFSTHSLFIIGTQNGFWIHFFFLFFNLVFNCVHCFKKWSHKSLFLFFLFFFNPFCFEFFV